MRFTTNMATRRYFEQQRIVPLCYLLIALLTVLLTWIAINTSSRFGELQRLKSDIAAYEERFAAKPKGVSEKDYNQMLSEIKFYNKLIDRKVYNWVFLLDALEYATPADIAIASITPDLKSGGIKLEARAHDFNALRSYMEKLGESKLFTNILLLSHQEISVGVKRSGVQFIISLKGLQA